MGWIEHKRSDSVKSAGGVFVSLRAAGIAFSAAFIREADVDSCSRVSVLVDPDEHRVGFRFHSQESDLDSYALTFDGGRASGRWIQCRRLYDDYRWMGEVLERDDPDGRRFTPERDPKGKLWFITIEKMTGPQIRKWAKRRADR